MSCIYQYAVEAQKLFIRMVGYMKYTESTGFDAFISSLDDEDVTDILIDLTEAEYLDSTNLGLIAQLGEKTLVQHHHAATIICPNKEITQILLSVGFDDVFMLLTSPEEDDHVFAEIPHGATDTQEVSKMMIKAHKKLMDLNEHNHEVFKEVVNLMEDDFQQL